MTVLEKATKDLDRLLLLTSDKVKKNAKVITNEELGQDYLLNIGLKVIKDFTPNVSKRAAPTEDNTIPRIHTSKTLLGCIVGFSSSEYLAQSYIPSDDGKDKNKNLDNYFSDKYLGGMYIHKIPFKVALQPNKKLVYDQEDSSEIWLVTYDEDTRKYPADVIGKLFISKMEMVPCVGSFPDKISTFYIEIADKDGIFLYDKVLLTKGYWSVQISYTNDTLTSKNFKLEKISKAEFDKDHQAKAALLSFETNSKTQKLYSW